MTYPDWWEFNMSWEDWWEARPDFYKSGFYEFTPEKPMTSEQADKYREWQLSYPGLGHKAEDFTCNNCVDRICCEFAWDTYNTNNDCLADK